jgi:hypothetical protein
MVGISNTKKTGRHRLVYGHNTDALNSFSVISSLKVGSSFTHFDIVSLQLWGNMFIL